MLRALAAATMTLILAPGAAAQVVTGPPRDGGPRPSPVATPPVGTGVFKGRVIDAGTGMPVSRARVRLMGPAGQRDPLLTDDSGAFAFPSLPPGPYTIAVERTGYLPGHYPENGQTVRTGYRPATLGDGQVLGGVTIPLLRGSVIAGRIIDVNGEPVESASVQAFRLSRSGRGRPQMRVGSSSNDIGEFRLAHLEAGRYLVLATPRLEMSGQPDGADLRPVPTFYPGVPTMDQAQPVTVERGGSATGLEITLIGASQAIVSGRLVDASGEPVSRNANVMVRRVSNEGSSNPVSSYSQSGGTGVKPDGTFQLRLAPGEYELSGHVTPMTTDGAPAPGTEQIGRVLLAVSGDVSDVVITLGRPARVTGRLVFDGTSPIPPLPTGPGQSLFFTSQDSSQACTPGRSQLAADGTFTVEGVSGTCVARLGGGLGRWTARSITYDGKDLMDQPIVLEPGQQLRDVQVILSDKQTELTMRVVDEQGIPTREYVVLVFSVDKARWTDNSRHIRWLMPPSLQMLQTMTVNRSVGAIATLGMTSGPPPAAAARAETLTGLPAGEYYAVAIDDIEFESLHDPELLERLSHGATRVLISQDARLELSLRRVKLADVPR